MEKPRILIIDDDPGLRKTLADILKVKGYEVLIACSGTEGLALLGDYAVNLVLIDLGLPDVAGLEVLDRVKAAQPLAEAIILTGNATIHSAMEATNRGAFSYMLKPCEMEALLLQIRRAIEKQQSRERMTRDSLALQKMNTELRALYAISQAIGRTINLEELLSEVLRTLAETELLAFVLKAAIFLGEGEKMLLASSISLSGAELEQCREIIPGECLCGQALESGEIVLSPNCRTDSRRPRGGPAVAHSHGHIVIPLKAGGEVIGLLNLYIEPEFEVREEMLNLLSSIASQLGIAVNNARLYEETKTFSLHDSLTGLANRRFMEIQLDKSLETAKRYRENLSVIMLDIDHFKDYNDTHGHPEGDRLLTRLAGILVKELRKADYTFRYGGEEFLIILPETEVQKAGEVAERLRKAVAAAGITISLGVAALNGSHRSKADLVAAADSALYRAKQTGRNRVEVD